MNDDPIAQCYVYTEPKTTQTFTNEDGVFELIPEKFNIGTLYNVTVEWSKSDATYTWTDIKLGNLKCLDLGDVQLKPQSDTRVQVDPINLPDFTPGGYQVITE